LKHSLILIGGGGHCISCIDVIESNPEFNISGIIDHPRKLQQRVLSYTITWTDNDIERLVKEKHSFLITIGFISNAAPRVTLFQQLSLLHADMPWICSSKAHLSQHAKIGLGTIVMHNTIVNAEATVGENVIINTGAVVEHNAKIGNHSHISTGAFVNGDCVIGDRVFIGSNSVICEGISIANDVMIGAGSVVIHSITVPGVYVGNPARKIR